MIVGRIDNTLLHSALEAIKRVSAEIDVSVIQTEYEIAQLREFDKQLR